MPIERKPFVFEPDPSRVIARFFMPGGEERARKIITRILSLPEKEVTATLNAVLREFANRHRNITRIFLTHFKKVAHLLNERGIDPQHLSKEVQILIGSYFTHEYSIESAAFFNPSIVEDPDQSHLQDGEKRVIVSFRATGEGHVSSIVFRRGVIDQHNNFHFEPSGRFVAEAETIHVHYYDKRDFQDKLQHSAIAEAHFFQPLFEQLADTFTLSDLMRVLARYERENNLSEADRKGIELVKWVADAQHLISFSLDSTLSERVIFPVMENESRGIEDARFVQLIDQGNRKKYYGTYTAYNGFAIMPQLIETIDFYTFRVMPIFGKYAVNKGMALFPRKVNGLYAMLGRMDGENNYLLFSDKINVWDNEPYLLQEPEFPWEFVQLGNSGSPIETPQGWLVITHGVGPMRKYCLGAILLDLDDPAIVIGKTRIPILEANENEREGYVPNVVYSCGAIRNQDHLIVPYAMSDTRSGFGVIRIDDLLKEMIPVHANNVLHQPQQQKQKILLVEDDAMTLEILHQLLLGEGYEVHLASDGLQALTEIANNNFDMVLSDIAMPNFSGFELLEYLTNKKIDIPLIFLTADKQKETELRGKALGAYDFLRKPDDFSLLAEKLRQYFGEKARA